MSQTHVKPNRKSATGTPRWAKVFGIIAFVVLLLFVTLMFTGGLAGHGPRRHGGMLPPASVVIENSDNTLPLQQDGQQP